MGQTSAFLRRMDGGYGFWCPGCEEMHVVCTEPGRWGFNGNVDRPTFTPSIKVTGHQIERDEHGKWTGDWVRGPDGKAFPEVCHSFVTDGQIRFLGDCTHVLAGKTVALPPLPAELRG